MPASGSHLIRSRRHWPASWGSTSRPRAWRWARVVPDSPAEKAGLKQGDVIIGFGGAKVNDPSSFMLKVATSEVAKPYEIVYLRDGKEQTVEDRSGGLRQGGFRQKRETRKKPGG